MGLRSTLVCHQLPLVDHLECVNPEIFVSRTALCDWIAFSKVPQSSN